MFHLIDKNNDLESLDKELIKEPFVSIDTEFRRTSKESIDLSLIQVNNSEETFLIDCILIGEYQHNCNFLSSTKVRKILHSHREDIEAIYSWTQLELKNIFDTQLANAFLGGSFSIGYRNLVHEKLGILIDKDETRSNWIRRPLRDSQLKYAADDVQFLIDLFIEQKKDLHESNKTEWFEEELQFNIKKLFSDKKKNIFLPGKKNLSSYEETKLLKNFNNIVLYISKETKINPTLIFSKKNQREFTKETINQGFQTAISSITKWRRDLVYDDLHFLFEKTLG